MKKHEQGPNEPVNKAFVVGLDGRPVIDKDNDIPWAQQAYKETLTDSGVRGRSLRRAMDQFETIIFDGNPSQTQQAIDFVEGISNEMGRPF